MNSPRNFYLDLKGKNRKLILKIGEGMMRQIEKLFARHSLIGDSTFFDAAQFSWVCELEKNWTHIREELDFILTKREQLPNFQDISTDQYSITKDNRWKTYFFYGYGMKFSKNCARCPQTTRLIEKIPGMTTAFFSILLPHKHIPEHTGVYKGVIRYHLGLKVPSPNTTCKIRVGDDIRYWEEGKSLIFDDRFPHEAWNDSDEVRVVLFLDFLRPVPFPYSLLNQLIIKFISWSPFLQDAKINQEKWDQKLDNLFALISSKDSE